MPEINSSRIREMLLELEQLGVIEAIQIPECVPEEVVCTITFSSMPKDVIDVEGVPTPIGSVLKQSTTVTKRGKLCLVTF